MLRYLLDRCERFSIIQECESLIRLDESRRPPCNRRRYLKLVRKAAVEAKMRASTKNLGPARRPTCNGRGRLKLVQNYTIQTTMWASTIQQPLLDVVTF